MLIFECVCNAAPIVEADYPSNAAYRQTVDAHRELCGRAPRAIDRLIVDALTPNAGPGATSPRHDRQAAGETTSPAANQTATATYRRPRNKATFPRPRLTGVPRWVRRRIAAWPIDPTDLRAH